MWFDKSKIYTAVNADEVFGDKEKGVEPLPYFRYAKNRIAVDLEEKEGNWWWLKTANTNYASGFCYSYRCGGRGSTCTLARHMHSFVRPRFAIKIGE